jgi:hypothetical protein
MRHFISSYFFILIIVRYNCSKDLCSEDLSPPTQNTVQKLKYLKGKIEEDKTTKKLLENFSYILLLTSFEGIHCPEDATKLFKF